MSALGLSRDTLSLPRPAWEMPCLLPLHASQAVCCRGNGAGSQEVLNSRELEFWLAMRGVEKRRQEWLLGRTVAKQAVRLLLERYLGVHVAPAEIEIVPDAYGRPQATGTWISECPAAPALSIAHSDGVALALAALDDQLAGIDLESMHRRREDFEAIAFRPAERKLIAAMPEDLRQEWALRMWCAKEAVGKALGRGLSAGLLAFEVIQVEANTGRTLVELRDGALVTFPHLRGKALIAYTTRDTEFVFATIMCQRGTVS